MNPLTATSNWTPQEIESTPLRSQSKAALHGSVFVKGVNRVNLGAHLMMLTILDEVRRTHPVGSVALPPSTAKDDWQGLVVRPRRNLRRIPVFGGAINTVARILPDVVVKWIPQVFDHHVGLVLDASGFLYSDQWGATAMSRAALDFEGLSKSGARIVLLPQAFGPFDDPECRRWMRRILEVVSLAVTRDAVSHAHLLSVAGDSLASRVVRGPDLTYGHRLGASPDPAGRDRVLIVPNYRMSGRTEDDAHVAYIRVLNRMIERLEKRGEAVSFLIHGEPGDRAIVDEVNAARETPIPLLVATDPVHGKCLVAGARFVIASRFHAVLAAVNTGVPCIGLGWSHKYGELFDDFGVPELYLTDWSESGVEQVLARLETPRQREAVRERFRERVQEYRSDLVGMWNRVWEISGGTGR